MAARTLYYPVDGHLWSRLNWALGLVAAGCDVVWLEVAKPFVSLAQTLAGVRTLQPLLAHHGIELAVAEVDPPAGVSSLTEALTADLLVSQNKGLDASIVKRFRKTAFVDVDPGMTQLWVDEGSVVLAEYDHYYTVGEGAAGTRDGMRWQHVPPCVALDAWPPADAGEGATFSTVTHWWGDKRAAFEPYLDLPRLTRQPLELALLLEADDRGWSPASAAEWRELEQCGWRLRDSRTLWEPDAYRAYIQGSLGEFSCAKPAYVRLETAWVSDRTVCYLASGKPVIVEHTGASAFLPDREGMLRFRSAEEAVECLEAASADYAKHTRAARELAEEHFDAAKVVRRVLETSL